jgi:Flp pilus assembly protein TadD
MSDPGHIQALWSRVENAEAVGNWPEAKDAYDELAALVDRHPAFITRHAIAVMHAGDPARAATMTRRAARMAPDDPGILLQLGKIYVAQKRNAEAEKTFRKVLELAPDSVEGLRRLAQTIQMVQAGHGEAEELLLRASELDPEDVGVWQQLGAIYGNYPERYDEAEAAFQRALSIEPNLPSSYHNLGLLRRFRADLDEAEKLIRKAVAHSPNDSGFAFSLGSCLMFKEEMQESLQWFQKSAELDDANTAAKVYAAFAMFLLGRMRDGWVQYEKRLALNELKDLNYSRPRWDGAPLEGKTLLLLREQGYGDNLQFVRYAEMAAERGGEVILLALPPLLRLFKSVRGVSFVTPATPEPKYFHRYCPLMSLPYVFETDENSVPAEVPYLSAEPTDVEAWRKRLEPYPGLKVGIAWRGNPQHTNDRFRSTSLEEMSRLLDIPGVTFFSMVMNRPAHEDQLPDGLVDISDGFNDFADTAAAIENLDLVITVDTSICHLAGALARPVWTMLARGPDFRWGLEGTTTPWYPTMTLYRQTVFGQWSDVYDRIEADLRAMAEAAAN